MPISAVSINGLQVSISLSADGSFLSLLGGFGITTLSLVLKYTLTKRRLPIIELTSAITVYFVFSSSVPDKLKLGRTKPKIINIAIGTAEPTPLAVLALEIIEPRSSALGVNAFGRLQNGPSDAV